MTVAMVAGFLLMGALAERLGRVGIKPMAVAATGMLVFMLAQATLVLELVPVPLPVWLVFGFFGTTGILCYASLSQSFPVELAGRVNTSLNLLVFVTAFAAQWLIGIIVNRFSLDGGAYGPQGYALGFGLMLALQAICYLWFLIAGRRVSA
jgi:MFS family permease